jgi:hypothetical protein
MVSLFLIEIYERAVVVHVFDAHTNGQIYNPDGAKS